MASRLMALALMAGTSCAVAQNEWDIWGYWQDDEHYLYSVREMPDFDQRRDANDRLGVIGLPNDGRMYCAPAAATDILAWIANHGHPSVPPFPEDWALYTARNWNDDARAHYNWVTSVIAEIGKPEYMNTSETGGTSGAGLFNGTVAFLRAFDEDAATVYSVQTIGVDGRTWQDNRFGSPTVEDGAFMGLTGAVMTMRWGYYDIAEVFDGTLPDLIRRTGGHIVAVQCMERRGDDIFVTVRNPSARDQPTQQGDFTTHRVRVEEVFFDSPNGNITKREVLLAPEETFSDFAGPNSIVIFDGFMVVAARTGMSVGSAFDVIQLYTLEPDGGGYTINTENVPIPTGDFIRGADFSQDQRHAVLVTGATGSTFGSLQLFDRANGVWEELLEVEYPNSVAFTRQRTIIAAQDWTISHVNPFDPTDRVIAEVFTPSPPRGLGVYDDADELIAFYGANLTVERYSLPDLTLAATVPMPSGYDWHMSTDFAVSPVDGTYWFAIGGDLFHVMHDNTVHAYAMPTPAEFLSLDEAGELLVTLNDAGTRTVAQYAEDIGQGQLVPLTTSPFIGLPVGPGFAASRARINIHPELFDEPGSDDLDVDTLLDTFPPPDPPDPRELCGFWDDLEDLGADGEVVTVRSIGDVTVTISTDTGVELEARTYGSGISAFTGAEGAVNEPFTPSAVSGGRFISTADSRADEFDEVQPIVFELSEPVRAFALSTIDLLEYPEAGNTLALRGYDAQGRLVAEHARTGRQGASGVVLHWLVESEDEDIVQVRLVGDHSACCDDYGIDDLAICPAAPAVQVVLPGVIASIHDEPRDGLGDSFNAQDWLLRETSTREDRAILEYDVSGFSGRNVIRATFDGRVTVNNSTDNGPRTFDFSVYEGNGQADLSDFEIGSEVIGSGEYHPPSDSYFDFSLDATSQVRSLMDGGAWFIGFKADCTSDPNFPNSLGAETTLTIEFGSCPSDFNSDGTVNTLDVLAFLNAWAAGDASADFNGDGTVNTLDVLAFLNAWAGGC